MEMYPDHFLPSFRWRGFFLMRNDGFLFLVLWDCKALSVRNVYDKIPGRYNGMRCFLLLEIAGFGAILC